jgi:hypothetical protein
VCPSQLGDTVRKHISHLAARGWEKSGDITVLSIPNERVRDGMFVTSEINRTASRLERDLRLLTVRTVLCDQTRLRTQILISPADLGLSPNTFARAKLPNALRGLRLDWLADLADSLANAWDHGSVDEARIETWLGQFETLESHRWIGERLLRVMDFWSSARIHRSLNLTCDTVRDYSHVCVNRRQPGKSADPLANKIQKRLNQFTSMKVADLYEVLAKQEIANILYIEDCLLTGTEITSLLRALLGDTPPSRIPKVPALQNQALLRDKNIVMHFLVATNMGSEILKQFLAENGIINVQISKASEEVVTLTPLGIRALREGRLFDEDKCLCDPSSHINAVAFQDTFIWGDHERIERAITFCRGVGEQLFRHYLNAMAEWQPWPERRVRESSLGVRSSALALAFAHSVPKATLPLFWMEGTVRLGNKEINWHPLFPSAA